MSIALKWMRQEAPYMPIATVGLLSVLADAGHPEATAGWVDGRHGATLEVAVDRPVEDVAQLVIEAPWPVLANVAWGDVQPSQGLKPTLKTTDDPLSTFQRICRDSPEIERRWLRSILSDGVVDNDGLPQRSRLLKGVKSDLSSVGLRPKKLSVDGVAAEFEVGPEFQKGSSGLGLGFVPEVQTFGGTTGRDPSGVGAYSPLLFLLLWHGLMALPPVGVRRGPRRVVGGPLVTSPDQLSWPRWRYPAGLRALRALLTWSAIHEERPNASMLAARNVDRVYRTRAVALSSMTDAYRWGEQVSG